MSLKEQILDFLDLSGGWINGAEIEKLSLSLGHKGETAGRVCRKLAEQGIIEKDYASSGTRSVIYRSKSTTPAPQSPEIASDDLKQPPMLDVRYPR